LPPQDWPASFKPQLPLAQALGLTQSLLLAQSRGQTPFVHLNDPQASAVLCTHEPEPLHVEAGDAEFPRHVGEEHEVPAE